MALIGSGKIMKNDGRRSEGWLKKSNMEFVCYF